jgi:hypothetical protein
MIMADRIKVARTVAIVLRAASLLSAGTSASAETFEERQACTGDAFQFCSSEIPNRDRVFSCLVASKDVISAACRSVIAPNAPVDQAPLRKLSGN